MLKWARILIIEDELLVAWSLRDVLSLIGCEVTGIAATVSEALILAENTKPDLALVDVRLAGQHDGIEGVVLLRRQFGLPIIFLTDEVDGEAAWRAAEVGPVEYLVRPVHTPQLVEAIRTAVAPAC
jgi:DNA-binding response OmpR family regulator